MRPGSRKRAAYDQATASPGRAAQPAGLVVSSAARSSTRADELERLARALLQPAPLDLRVNTLLANARGGARRTSQRDGIAAAADAVLADGRAPGRQTGAAASSAVPGGQGRGAGRGQPAADLSGRAAAPRDGGGLLRGRRRQDAGAGRADELRGTAVRLRHRRHSAWPISSRASGARDCRTSIRSTSTAKPTRASSGWTPRSTACWWTRPAAGSARCAAIPTSSGARAPTGIAEMTRKAGSDPATRPARLVKPGGRLVYATCSLLREENEAIVDAFLARNPTIHARSTAARSCAVRASSSTPGLYFACSRTRTAWTGFSRRCWSAAGRRSLVRCGWLPLVRVVRLDCGSPAREALEPAHESRGGGNGADRLYALATTRPGSL